MVDISKLTTIVFDHGLKITLMHVLGESVFGMGE